MWSNSFIHSFSSFIKIASKMSHFYSLNNPVRHQLILIKFGVQLPKKITCCKRLQFWPSCLKIVTTLPCKIRKSYSISLPHARLPDVHLFLWMAKHFLGRFKQAIKSEWIGRCLKNSEKNIEKKNSWKFPPSRHWESVVLSDFSRSSLVNLTVKEIMNIDPQLPKLK